MIRADPTMGEDIMGVDRLPAGRAAHAAEHRDDRDRLEDFMRRRSKIDLVVRDARHPRLAGPARGRRDPVRRGCRAPARHVRRVQGPHVGRQPLTATPQASPSRHRTCRHEGGGHGDDPAALHPRPHRRAGGHRGRPARMPWTRRSARAHRPAPPGPRSSASCAAGTARSR